MFLGYIDPGSGFTIFNAGGWLLSLVASALGFGLIFFKKLFLYFKKKKKIKILLILLVAGLSGLLVLRFMMTAQKKFKDKIIILGFDGLDASKVETLMENGRLPNFARLKEQGSYRHLATTNPAQSPVAWSSFATGQNPGKTGIYDFIVRNPKDYSMNLATANITGSRAKKTLKAKAFWTILSQARIPSTILNCPVTFPPDKIYGRMLSGMGVPDILGTEGTFTFYTTEPIATKKETGGNVLSVPRASEFTLNLIGPRVKNADNSTRSLRVPFKTTISQNKKSITIEYKNTHITLKPGQWSAWQKATFRAGLFNDIAGIYKFFLRSIEPEFRLYISPIQFDPRAPYQAISSPKSYSREIAKEIGLFHTQGMPIDTWAVNEGRLSDEQLLQQADEIFNEEKNLLNFELKRFHRGVLFSYFGVSDIVQHMFWRAIDPGHPMHNKDTAEKYKDTIDAWYAKFDALLGEVMRQIDKNTTLIVLSDHGFNTFRRNAHVNAWLKENGYLKVKNPLSVDEGLLKNIDWAHTKAYALGFGAIYVNQRGREAQGIVKPGEETEALKNELVLKLKDWKDEKTNTAVLRKTYKKEEIFSGPWVEDMPDLYLGFNIGLRASWQTAMGAVPQILLEDNLKKWSGDHMFDPALVPAILFINKPIVRDAATIYDLAPTILKIAGFSKKELDQLDLDGEPLL